MKGGKGDNRDREIERQRDRKSERERERESVGGEARGRERGFIKEKEYVIRN